MKTFKQFMNEEDLNKLYKERQDLSPEDKKKYKEMQDPKDPNTSEKLLKPA